MNLNRKKKLKINSHLLSINTFEKKITYSSKWRKLIISHSSLYESCCRKVSTSMKLVKPLITFNKSEKTNGLILTNGHAETGTSSWDFCTFHGPKNSWPWECC